MAATFTKASEDEAAELTRSHAGDRAATTRFDRLVARLIQRSMAPAPVRLLLWDGSTPYDQSDAPVGDLILRDRRALLGLLVHPDLCFGEAYMTARLDVRGPLVGVLDALSRSDAANASWLTRVTAALSPANNLRSARRNVAHHYDLGNDFYKLWLDEELVYTCAYFPAPETELGEAQRAKLDLVCRKLRLRPDETVIEAGCGWGALALHMARRYGVRVKAFNVSREQLELARTRAVREGLASRVEFIDDDYRNVSGRFDAFVSVGMLEHVGRTHFRTVATVLRQCLRRDGGRGLVHFIGRDTPRPVNAWIRRRIFPGSYVPTLAEVSEHVLGPAGMSIVDVENLRLHYARTLALWRERFDTARDQVLSTLDEEFRRTWELYLAGSEAAFRTGWLQLFQVVFAPRESRPPYWRRDDLERLELGNSTLP